MKKILIMAASSFLMLSGCEIIEETRSVDWYVSHPAELTAKIDECKRNPGELEETANCKNAEAARWKNLTKKGENTPSVGF